MTRGPRPALALYLALKRRLEQQAEDARGRERAMRKRRLQLRRCQELRRIAAAAESLASRRYIERTVSGWSSSTLAGYLAKGDELTYKLNFRMTKRSVQLITDQLSAAGHVVDSKCRNKKLRVTAAFKVGVCLYFMAHAKGDMKVAGDVVGLGKTTVYFYLKRFCADHPQAALHALRATTAREAAAGARGVRGAAWHLAEGRAGARHGAGRVGPSRIKPMRRRWPAGLHGDCGGRAL